MLYFLVATGCQIINAGKEFGYGSSLFIKRALFWVVPHLIVFDIFGALIVFTLSQFVRLIA